MQFTATLDEILRRVDIVALAKRLGLVLGRREGNYTTAICPFHNDRAPSLALFQDVGNPHYHCFSCGAHGGALDLVASQRHAPRDEALRWLAQEVGVELPKGSSGPRDDVAALGRSTFSEWLRRNQRKELLRSFAQQRGLEVSALHAAGALAVDMSKLAPEDLSPGEREALETAGVVGRRRSKLVPIATGKQIVFPLDSGRGFIFRALDQSAGFDKARRYRFSKGMKKSDVLFGAALAQEMVASPDQVQSVFIVEGIMDVLRLRSLGLPAVGILGTNVSKSQAEQIQKLCSPEGRPVAAAHLFLDSDDAGRRATPGAIRTLLATADPMPLDIIRPDPDGDPDELLRGLEAAEALRQLGDWTYSALSALAHAYTDLPIASALTDIVDARPLLRVEAIRYISAQFAGRWSRLRDLADPSAVYLEGAHREDAAWLRDALDRAAGYLPTEAAPIGKAYKPSEDLPSQPDIHLRQALRLAQSSNFRREYPFDWGGMTRLALAANASILVGRALLADPRRRPIPYPARVVPKEDGRTRLKAGPWPEDALLQQYVLTELLRARPDAPGWYLEFPCVRLIRSSNAGPIVTGPPELRPIGPPDEAPPVVSFAYQIDQEVLEGETPPRREGMFVPYRECWQQFIDHLDTFVARQPLDTDTFYAVRLDISGFFDNLPRYAVEEVLRSALGNGAERHFSGRDFRNEVASLLPSPGLPDGDAGHRRRGEFLADWLADQSFDFQFFDPADGQVQKAPNPTVGIPQGPDLSAFLANLSLFPLDREVTRLVEDERRTRITEAVPNPTAAAVYGRYVDDMVIVSTSEALLVHLESTIGEQLRKLRLAMNAKHERTRALSRRKIREWLLGERGAAVLVSAGGEDTPTTSRARVEDLLEVGPDTSRSQVLQLLHHTDLYATSWAKDIGPVRRVESTLKHLRSLPSVKLRYYDWVSAARWCLHSLALREPQSSAEVFAENFLTWWRDIYGRDEAIEAFGEGERERAARQEQLNLTPLLIALDALERSIDSRYDRRGGTDADVRGALRASRERLAKMVCEQNLFAFLLSSAQKDPAVVTALPRVAAMLKIQDLATRGLVANAEGASTGGPALRFERGGSYAQRRFAMNALGRRIGEHAAPIMAEIHGLSDTEWAPDAEPLLGLHEAIARLIGAAPQAGDPLAPLTAVTRRWLQLLSAAESNAGQTDLAAAVKVISLTDQFLEQPGESTSYVKPATALRAFVEVVAGAADSHALMSARPHLVSELAGGGFKPIAVSPGVDASAFFARQNGNLKAFAFVENEAVPRSEEVIFGVEADAGATTGRLAEYACKVPQTHRISSPRPPRLHPESVKPADLKAFAQAYRELAVSQAAALQEEAGDGDRRPLTPLHLLEPTSEGANWRSFGAMARLPVGPQAFLRLGEDRLHSLAVHVNGAYLWQVGFALADHLGYRGFARSSELDRLVVGTLEPTDTVESIPFYVMQLTVPRLCGAFMGRARFQIRPEQGLPAGLDRQLARLETFRDDEPNPVVHLGHLLEAGAEAKAAELLRETPAPLQVAGALSAVFRSIGRAASRPERIFAQNLPPAKPSALTNRRTVDLWLSAASRLDGIAGEESLGLKTAAAAMRVLALSRLAQALTLEVWSLLRDDDLQRLEHFAPDPSEMDLPEEVLLVGGRHMQRSPASGDQVVRLLSALAQHAAPGATARGGLDQITPLGWVVALATITGLLDLEPLTTAAGAEQQRPELLSARKEERQSSGRLMPAEQRLWDALVEVCRFLAQGVEDGTADAVQAADWPWGAFAPLVGEAERITGLMAEAAGLIEQLYGLRAITRESPFFQMSDADERGYCLVSREGRSRQSLAGWQIDRDSLGVTRPGDLEARKDPEGAPTYVWSETILGERLVSLSVGYRTLAEFAGAPTALEEQAVEAAPVKAPPAEASETEQPRREGTNDATGAAVTATATASEVPPIEARSNEDSSSARQAPPRPEDASLMALKNLWNSSRGGSRALGKELKPVSLRIAILQMNIERIGHSFYHPSCETNDHKFKDWEKFLKNFRRNGKQTGDISIFEAWRRAILEEALDRCKTLEVELLVLPEYATRPDTIAWLAAEHERLAPQTSILAGTFRHAARAAALPYDTGVGPSRPVSLGAIVPLIVPGPALRVQGRGRRNSKIYSRLKKYPSTGLSEFMRPEIRPLKSVYDMEGYDPELPERLRYVRDLICSEVFMAMSPANIYSSVPALLELHARFGQPVNADWIVEKVIDDIRLIAQATSPAIAHDFAQPRQTIIAVPAATTRPFDHHIFGEAGAKAAGLTTVFANMSGKGRGESCFIGHYRSSEIEGSHVWSLHSPYHGRAPGMWTYNFSGGKALGAEETALIVADVNPIDTSTSKPARQIETQPLTLVAHIPFFLGSGTEDDPMRITVQQVAAKILALGSSTESAKSAMSSCELEAADFAAVREITDLLASIDPTAKESLKFRSEGIQVASMQPHVHPRMPALIDWAYVPAPKVGVQIEVPSLEAIDLEGSAKELDG